MKFPNLHDYLPPDLHRAAFFDKRQAAALKQAIEEYMNHVENWPDLDSEAVSAAFLDLEKEETRSLGAPPATLAAFESGKRRLLILRDRVLAQEGQEMSAATFWSEEQGSG